MTSGATDTQKTLLLALAEGWRLRFVEGYGWCLFQAGRERPFAKVKRRTVAAMTDAGWLEAEETPKGLGFRPAKDLTAEGRRYAEKLISRRWAECYRWDPFGSSGSGTSGDEPSIRLAA